MVRVTTFIATSLCVLTACTKQPPPVAEQAPETHAAYTAQQFFETTQFLMAPATGHAFSPDGEALLISSDATGVRNVYRLPVDGGEAEPLTFSEDQTVSAVSWFPHDERFLYTFDAHGNEQNHVFVQEEDGIATDLTPGDGHKAGFIGWHDDGASFYVSTTERDPGFFDVYR